MSIKRTIAPSSLLYRNDIRSMEKLFSGSKEFPRPGEKRTREERIFVKSRRFQSAYSVQPLLLSRGKMLSDGRRWVVGVRDSATREVGCEGRVAKRGWMGEAKCSVVLRPTDPLDNAAGVTDLPHARNSRRYDLLSVALLRFSDSSKRSSHHVTTCFGDTRRCVFDSDD